MKDQRNKKIKLLCEYFHPEPASTGQLMTQLAVDLQGTRFDIEVFTSQPTYQGQEISKLPEKENYKGVKINRLNSSQLNKEKGICRIINWLTFTFMVLVNISRKSRSRDILLILSNPPILPFVGLFFNLLRKQRYAIIIYDVYPDIAEKLGVIRESSFFAKIWNIINRLLYKKASSIITLGKKMKETVYKKSNGLILPSKIRVIHNWENPEFIKPIRKKNNSFAVKYGYDKKLTLLYSGNLGQHHDLMTIIKTAEKVRNLPVKFVFIGDGVQKRKLQKYVKEKDLNNVDFHPYQPLGKLPETLTCADVSIVSEDIRATGLCVSCKIYSSLASGQAILAMVDKNSDIAHIVKECNCGMQVSQGAVEEFEKVIKFWLDNPEGLNSMGVNGRKCFEKKYTLKQAIEGYAKVLKKL